MVEGGEREGEASLRRQYGTPQLDWTNDERNSPLRARGRAVAVKVECEREGGRGIRFASVATGTPRYGEK